ALMVAGSASGSTYGAIGFSREMALMLAYEGPIVLVVAAVALRTGAAEGTGVVLSLAEIVRHQQAHGANLFDPVLWPAFLAFVFFYPANLGIIPFDIPEAESELVAGITTEYTGMKFGLFYMAEYLHTVIASAVAASLFLGGYDGPFAPGVWWMVAKTFGMVVAIYYLRWSLMRFRSDQLMALCWRWLVPTGVVLVVASALFVVFAS
ncbi:MAG: complex I subunit 1 family protein, partial [Myxococcaceae bacterium]